MGPFFKFVLAESWGLNPRCPFGAYSLSRRAPSASRSALRNSRSIVTKQPKLGKREFGAIPFLPFPHRLQQIVAHIRNCKRNTAIARRLNQPRIDETFTIRADLVRRQPHLFGDITVGNLIALALSHCREILNCRFETLRSAGAITIALKLSRAAWIPVRADPSFTLSAPLRAAACQA